jgi:hypothetical protein
MRNSFIHLPFFLLHLLCSSGPSKAHKGVSLICSFTIYGDLLVIDTESRRRGVTLLIPGHWTTQSPPYSAGLVDPTVAPAAFPKLKLAHQSSQPVTIHIRGSCALSYRVPFMIILPRSDFSIRRMLGLSLYVSISAAITQCGSGSITPGSSNEASERRLESLKRTVASDLGNRCLR